MRLYYKSQRRVCSKKEKDISIIKNKEKGGSGICKELVKKGVYSTIKITIDITNILCTEETRKVSMTISYQHEK